MPGRPWTTSRHTADLAAESLRLINLRYQAGESTALEVVDAQNTLTRRAMPTTTPRFAIAWPWRICRRSRELSRTCNEVRDETPCQTDRHLGAAIGERAPGCQLGSGGRAGLLAGVLLSGCSTKEAAEAAPTVTVQVGAAENEPIERKVTADAILYPRDQAAIVPKISAPVKKFYVDRGSTVHAGQLLAELENQDLAGAVNRKPGRIPAGGGDLPDAPCRRRSRTSSSPSSNWTPRRSFTTAARRSLKQGAVSAKDVDDAQIALTQAQNQYETRAKAVRPEGRRRRS